MVKKENLVFDTVGKNEGRIAEYIKHQLEENKLGEQLRIPIAEKKKWDKVARRSQTVSHVVRVPRGIRAMPACDNPRVSRGDGY